MIRPALPAESEIIYSFGFDVWSSGQPMEAYLEGCRNSEKYKKGQWWVLENSDKIIVSAVISYNLGKQWMGIGSLCTPLQLRKRGYASQLLQAYLGNLDTLRVETIFLWSDIKPEFYERFGFKPLPKRYQPHKDTTCMWRAMDLEAALNESTFEPPKYF